MRIDTRKTENTTKHPIGQGKHNHEPNFDPKRLSDIGKQGEKWDRVKADSVLLSEICAGGSGLVKMGKQIAECANSVYYAKAGGDSDGKWALARARFCRQRHCPVCAWRRSMKWQSKFYAASEMIDHDIPTARWLFVTLTVRNVNILDLKSAITHLNKSWQRLVKQKEFAGIGWVKTIETTINKKDCTEVHPHIHALVLVKSSYFKSGNYLNHEGWVNLWKKCARLNYRPSVNVQAVRKKTDGATREVIKSFCYSIKPAEFKESGGVFVLLHKQLKGSRAVGVGGVLKKYLSPKIRQPKIEGSDFPQQRVFRFFWDNDPKYYRRKKD